MRKDFGSIGIDNAFQLKQQPVYVVTRHGRSKKSFSRETAIRRLAHFMVQKTFDRAGVPTHEGGYQKEEGGVIHFHRGEITLGYWQAHHRCERRIRKLLARKRDKEKWQREYDEWVSKHDDLMKRRPY
ncbi:hypothetical protein SM12BL1_39580 [Serratia marcescens]|uniref:hypothetical protein n=1 Tax=Serratia marcescens TaxID=615 RepID=UPI0007454ADB|nr:hypothetical protein [Serratia marcescens]CUZ93742.1 Uncharacterised protein [Serratia marcescens]CVA66211.1 Uncharacterised protein [Serratia marcescens]CVB76457.1 Uncharacterised protein [Serratia marcescens]CVC60493.1 Uncharacterised protein [Serratia marcescens]CVD56391.1 Uncharacterised protein [Serratia marcescens]